MFHESENLKICANFSMLIGSFRSILTHSIGLILLAGLELYARLTNRMIIARKGDAIGEHVALTATVRLIHEQWLRRIIVITSYPDIFQKNPSVERSIDAKNISPSLYSAMVKWIWRFPFDRIKEARFRDPDGTSFAEVMRSRPDFKALHLAQAHSWHFTKQLNWSKIEPYVHVDNEDVVASKAKYDLSDKRYALVVSETKTSFTPNKNWGAARFQNVVEETKGAITWVQVGHQSDACLTNARDLRGQTTLQELATLLKGAEFVLCPEGLLTHLAAAVGRPSITIYTGFLSPSTSMYGTTTAITATGVDCAPCWLLTPCPYTLKCADTIEIRHVTSACINQWQRDA